MRRDVVGLLRTHRTASLVILDACAWMAALYIASSLRLETWLGSAHWFVSSSGGHTPVGGVLLIGTLAIGLHTLGAWVLRLHQGRASLGSFDEIFLLANVMAVVGILITTFNFLAPQAFLARTTPIVATCLAIVFCAWPRGLWRILIRDSRPAQWHSTSNPSIIIGAGPTGSQLVDSMLRDPAQHWRPLGFLDDDPHKKHFRFRGVPVLGKVSDLESAASRVEADTIVIALPGADPKTIKGIYESARSVGLVVKVLPTYDESLNVTQASVRDIGPEDLLGRAPVETDVASIAGCLHGKRVLVTGAGGSIGSELCRQISTYNPEQLVLLDRDESALHELLLSMTGRADLESTNVVLANIREADRMQEVFSEHRPEVVFHAAALKHVNILELQAAEAVKTNVIGTINVLEAARAVGVERFVNISTDKAADPVTVLGHTKRIAEGLTTATAANSDGVYLSVRFGNVLGTRGSVLKTFAAQIDAGGPLTVTDPEATRYFMTIHEAVQLVVQAAAIGRDGEALVLDMGEPVKIVEVAKQLVESAGSSIDIVFTGLKPREKLHEVLLGTGEIDVRPIHPYISHVHVPSITHGDILSLLAGNDNAEVVRRLAALSGQMQDQVLQKALP